MSDVSIRARDAAKAPSDTPPPHEPLFSLVISTIGPAEGLFACLSSILAQTQPSYEVIVVDQNATDHVRAITEAFAWSGKVHYTRSEVGLSKGRNAGLALARGTYVGFPDDDCSYPPTLLQQVRERFRHHADASGICVRCIDHRGHDSAGRSDRRGGLITKRNVWSRAVSVGIFLKRAAVTQTGGFDERIGLGSNTPFLSGEETDLLLTLVRAGHRIHYDPLLHVFHPPNPPVITAKHITRSYAYGMGKGLLLRRHAYKHHHVAIHVVRPVLGAFLAAIRGNLALARLRIRRAQGRYDGWRSVSPNSPDHR